MSTSNRRQFLKRLALATGAVVLVPHVTACGPKSVEAGPDPDPDPVDHAIPPAGPEAPPMVAPEGWDPVAYNTARGNAGAIPDTYLGDINGPEGDTKHLGKHLPYVPDTAGLELPAGFIALMWGDEAKGHARHPNAPKSADNAEGHWYNWIKVRKAVDGEAEELQSTYTDWPGDGADSSGKYAVFGGGDIAADKGKNTVYMAALPADVQAGDTIRIWAHCLTHGEYVDFLTV